MLISALRVDSCLDRVPPLPASRVSCATASYATSASSPSRSSRLDIRPLSARVRTGRSSRCAYAACGPSNRHARCLTDRVDEELLGDRLPQLKVVANYALSFDNIDLQAAPTRGPSPLAWRRGWRRPRSVDAVDAVVTRHVLPQHVWIQLTAAHQCAVAVLKDVTPRSGLSFTARL